MGKLALSLFGALLISLTTNSHAQTSDDYIFSKNGNNIRVIPVIPTPESNNVNTYLVFPQEGEMIMREPIDMQVLLEGFPIGVNSDFPREEQVQNNPYGQGLAIVIDNQPAFVVNGEVINSLDGSENYFDDLLNINIPWELRPGMHIIRMFPVRSFGESIKGENAYATRTFQFQSKQKNPEFDLSKPYITYNEPQGKFSYGEPILLDFYVSNCVLSADGYMIDLVIDGHQERKITLWTPYYIFGLTKGKHVISLQLIGPDGEPVPGELNSIQRTIRVE